MPAAEVILVVSTCGLGEFPANSKQTWLKLQSQDGSHGHIMGISWEYTSIFHHISIPSGYVKIAIENDQL
jgi:hypothetical protein